MAHACDLIVRASLRSHDSARWRAVSRARRCDRVEVCGVSEMRAGGADRPPCYLSLPEGECPRFTSAARRQLGSSTLFSQAIPLSISILVLCPLLNTFDWF